MTIHQLSMNQCVTGAPITASTPAGVGLLDQAIESYMASRIDTPAILKQAIREDPDHLMARCTLGYLARLAGDRANAARSAGLYRDLAEQIESGAGTSWERGHVTALGLWLADDLHRLMTHFEKLLEDWPGDVLALRMLHYLYFYDGNSRRMRDSVADHLPRYAGHPLEGYVKGMLAFGLEEAGDYEAAERYGREAVEANPADAWAAHAVGHVMEMQGRHDEGIAWIRQLRRQWAQTNNFRFHLFWHETLYHLARRDVDAVLELYDGEIGPAVADDFYLDMCNAASLLLRLEALGANVGDRWTALTEVAERHVEDAELVFASLHYLMPLVRTGHPAGNTLLTALEQWSRRDSTQGHVVRDVGLGVAAFLLAVQRNDTAAASGHYERFRRNLHRIGGSHAQRQLFSILYDTHPGARPQ